MISAVWPMPESHVPAVSKEDYDVQRAIKFLQQKNEQFNKAFINISAEEKLKISSVLEDVIKQLSTQMVVNKIMNINNIDLDDAYQFKGKIPFPKFKQPSLFEGSIFDPNLTSPEDEPF